MKQRFIQTILSLALISLARAQPAVPTFTDIQAGIEPLSHGGSTWADYDNDGDLDLLVTGALIGGDHATRLYRNSGDGTFEVVSAGLLDLANSFADWGDYDNDGRLDLLIGGTTQEGARRTLIYRNGGDGTFSEAPVSLPGIRSPALAWSDFDNDGDLDFLLAGSADAGAITRIYRNDGNNVFTDIQAELPPAFTPSAAWGDYDNDSDPDLLITGSLTSGFPPTLFARVYRNNGDGTFSDIKAGLPNLASLRSSSAVWSDYDSDGNLDITVNGTPASGPPVTRRFRNAGNGTFSAVNTVLPGSLYTPVAWGDMDNDGDIDLWLVALEGPTSTRLYRNGGNSVFTRQVTLPGLLWSAMALGDFDNDGDLDLFQMGFTGFDVVVKPGNMSIIYRNDIATVNTPPTAPTGLTAEVQGDSVILRWDAAVDAQTPSASLAYDVRVGTTPGGFDIVSATAAANGFRRIPSLGNAQHRRTLILRPERSGKFYWSVQAIDTALVGSPFAPEGSFTLAKDAADDFADGNDDGWRRYDVLAAVGGTPATFEVKDGAYHLHAPLSPNPAVLGPPRAGAFYPDTEFTDFTVSVDVLSWDHVTETMFGVVARANDIGLGKTSGYYFRYCSHCKNLDIDVIRGEQGSKLARKSDLILDPAKDYRFVFTGISEYLRGDLYDLENPATPIVTLTALDNRFASGLSGLLIANFKLLEGDATFDNYRATVAEGEMPGYATSINLTGDGAAKILFKGNPGTGYAIQASDDLGLAQWTTLGSREAGPDRRFEFLDTEAAAKPMRIYRLRKN